MITTAKMIASRINLPFNSTKNFVAFSSRSLTPQQPFKPLFKKVEDYSQNIAVVDNIGRSSYKDILLHSYCLADEMRKFMPTPRSQTPERICFLCPSDASYVSVLLACWLSGCTAVPLCRDHPASMYEYFISDSQSSLIVASAEFYDKLKVVANKLKLPLLNVEHPLLSHLHTEENVEDFHNSIQLQSFEEKGAIIIYTSGTTGPPKGVVLTHGNFEAQVSAVIKAWGWTSKDIILNTLPLHHIHGLMYALLCPLNVGATVVLQKFDTLEVWKRLINYDNKDIQVNLYFAVPTMYAKLIEKFEIACQNLSLSKDEVKERCMKKIRLMASGSASLPDPVLHKWESITGHRILERYGMSEIGMALSNPLNGPRIPGSVGNPLPEVEVRIVKMNDSSPCGYDVLVHGDHKKTDIAPGHEGEAGELLVRGPAVFTKYWNKPDATKKSFKEDGWFITGDTVVYEDGVYRILGRTSADIIKSGGYKISALDVERHLLAHPDIAECSVLGLPDNVWGEKVTAVILTRSGNDISLIDLKAWCKKQMPAYCVPKIFKFVKELPRNIMGKVNKKDFKEKLLHEFKFNSKL